MCFVARGCPLFVMPRGITCGDRSDWWQITLSQAQDVLRLWQGSGARTPPACFSKTSADVARWRDPLAKHLPEPVTKYYGLDPVTAVSFAAACSGGRSTPPSAAFKRAHLRLPRRAGHRPLARRVTYGCGPGGDSGAWIQRPAGYRGRSSNLARVVRRPTHLVEVVGAILDD